MSTNLNDKSANALSDMAYISDKLGQIKDVSKYDNVDKIFYNNDGTLRTEFKDTNGNEISGLKEYAQKINDNRDMYSDVLNSKLVGTANDETGYKGIAVQNSDGSVTVASAGTDSAMDTVSDAQMAMGKIPLQLESAKNFYNSLKQGDNPPISADTSIDFTGHSLGGSLSELLAVDLVNSGNIRGVKAFEPYGVAGVIDNDLTLSSKYYSNQALIDGMVKSYVSQLDPVANWAKQVGIPVNAFSKDGAYTQKSITDGGFFYHKLDRYGILAYDSDGNIIQGQVNYKNLLKAMRDDPENLSNYLALYDAIKDFKPSGESSLDNFISDCLSSIDRLFLLSGTTSALDAIMAGVGGYKTAQGASVALPRRDPITVDMDNDGIETTDTEGGVYFDLDGDGTKEKTSWVKADDAFIVKDRDENGTIDSGKELYGDATILKDGTKATTGFQALSEEDTNNDKVIDSSDENFDKLKIWQDKNQDGISQADELQSLSNAGITKIHLDYLTVNADDGKGNIQTRTSGFEFADGRTGITGEFLFDRNTIDTSNPDYTGIAEDIFSLPYLRGFGQVTDLYHAMANDAELKQMVEEFVSTNCTNVSNIASELSGKFESILFKWAGVDTIEANSRGGNIDARRLSVLEKFFAENFEGFGAIGTGERSANPNAAAAAQLNNVYNGIMEKFYANMSLQSHLKEYVMLDAVEMTESGEVKINEDVADFILGYQKQSTDNSQLFYLKFFSLANTVKTLGSTTEKEDFVNYFLAKNDGIYADGLKLLSTNKILIGGNNNDTLTGDGSDNRIYGFNGDDIINAGDGSDVVEAGDGNNTVYAGSGDDKITSGTGSDTLYGEAGSDILDGGKGDDYLSGGEHSDTYIYRKGNGSDTIEEWNDRWSQGTSADKVKFEDINASDIQDIILENKDIILKFKDTTETAGDQIRFKNWFRTDVGDGSYQGRVDRKIEKFTFADGTEWTSAQLESNLKVYGTDGNDILYGDNSNDTFYGGKGDDYLNGGKGSNTYIYRKGDGNDIIEDNVSEKESYDKLKLEDIIPGDIYDIAKSGRDIIMTFKDVEGKPSEKITFKNWFYSEAGNGGNNSKIEEIEFADGTKWGIKDIESNVSVIGTKGSDYLYGTSADNKIYGLEGNDFLYGGEGNDIYIYRRGDGNDQILEWNDIQTNGKSYDKLKLEGINPSDIDSVTMTSEGALVITFKATETFPEEKITIPWLYNSTDKYDYKLEEIEFADGTKWNTTELENKVFTGSDKDDYISGTAANDTIGGKKGNDQIYGHEGNDIIQGGSGDDFINGGNGNDALNGEDGNDQFYGENGNDLLVGGSGNDVIYGGSGNDILNGGTGSDNLEGGENDDTYIYRRGDSNDTIVDTNNIQSNGRSTDKLKLEGINPADVDEIARTNSDLIIVLKATDTLPEEKITISNWFSSNNDSDFKLEEIEFADGTKWNAANLESMAVIAGTEGNDYIAGTSSNDKIYGNKGDDYLEGGEGSDTYIYRRGDGNDTISDCNDIQNNGKSYDKLKLEGINPSDISRIMEENGSLVIVFKETEILPEERITINNWTWSDEKYNDNKLEEIEFGDGTKWGIKDIEKEVFFEGTDNAEYMAGSSANEIITAGKGNDEIWGGDGSDTYIYRKGDGSDIIYEWNNYQNNGKTYDKLKFEDINSSDIAGIFREGNDLTLVLKATDTLPEEKITFKSWFFEDGRRNLKLEEIEFANGEKWDTEKIEKAGIAVTYGDNTISGSDGNDYLTGSNSNDTISGGTGDDYLFGGTGNNVLIGGEGNDVYIYDPQTGGNDVIIANKYDNLEIYLVPENEFVKERLSDSNDLVLKIVNQGVVKGSITLKDYYLSDENKIQSITFYPDDDEDESVIWTKEQIESNVAIIEPIIKGTSGDDALNGTDRDDTMEGGKGNDILSGGAGADTYIYSKGDGSDIITDGTADKLELKDISSGEVNFIRKNGDLVIAFKDRSDTSEITLQNWFASGFKLSEISFADGSKWGVSDIEAKLLKPVYGTDKNDSITGTAADEIIYAKAGDDRVYGKDGTDTVYAGDGNDKVYGGTGDDTLHGEDGDDYLYGEAGNDTLIGGKGNDYLAGGEGNNIYIFNKGDGNDIVYGLNDITTTGVKTIDTIRFAGFVREDIQDKIKEGNDLIIQLKNEGLTDSIRVKNYFASTEVVDSNQQVVGGKNYKIENFEFDDVVLSSAEIESALNSYGTDGNDSITGTAGSNTIYGRKGDDTLRGLSGKDIIYGEEDNDKVYGGDGDDELSGGAGDDKLYGEGGNDLLDGGTGSDYMSGGEGNNTYVYRKGDGSDIIEDRNYSADKSSWAYDKLKLEGILPSDIESVSRTGYDFIIKIKNGELIIDNGGIETITFKNWFYGDVANNSYNFKTEEIEFADGTKWSSSDIQKNLTVYGTDNNDSIIDTSEGNTIYAKAGDDRVYGKDGNDTVYAGDGNDKVYGGAGDDTLYGEDSDDYLYGEAGNDTLIGGKGNDYLAGGEGSNTYVFNKGDGSDTIIDINDITNNGASFDKLKLQDISKEDIGEINREGSDLVIKFVEGGGENAESIRIKSWFASSEVVDSNQQVVGGKNYKIEEIEFSDGSKWGVTDIEQLYKYKITGTDNADKLGGKNDHGMIIEGKKGDDVITGGTKEDTYIVNSGDGNDVIKTTGGGEDTIKVNASSDSLSFKAMNMNDMVMFLHDVNGSASLTLTGYLDQQKHEMQKIKQVEALSDGAILTEKNLQLLIQAMASFETEKGITWEKAVEQKDPQIKEILSQYWSYEKKE